MVDILRVETCTFYSNQHNLFYKKRNLQVGKKNDKKDTENEVFSLELDVGSKFDASAWIKLKRYKIYKKRLKILKK